MVVVCSVGQGKVASEMYILLQGEVVVEQQGALGLRQLSQPCFQAGKAKM